MPSSGASGRRWTVDPVDGTKGFLRGDQYAIALALIDDGEVVLAVLGCPNLPIDPHDASAGVGCAFVAERNGGAWQVPLDTGEAGSAEWRPIRVDAATEVDESTWVESFEPSHSSQGTSAAIASLLGICRPPMRLDSQAKYAVVARGDASVYLRLPRTSYVERIWDHAGGSLLVQEAGGVVTDARGHDLDLGAGRTLVRNRGIVAAPRAIHDRVLSAVAQVLAD